MSDIDDLVSFLRKNDLLTSDIRSATETIEFGNGDPRMFHSLAIKELEPFVASHPRDAEGHARLGNAYYSSGRIDRAITQFELSLKIDPGNYSVRHDLGVALQEKGLRDGGC